VAADQGPAVAEADGVGHVVVRPDIGAVSNARAWRMGIKPSQMSNSMWIFHYIINGKKETKFSAG
jgi:hypothetical protein